jgi:16S rRNA (uracil1498-N3)-methyltransferase
MRRFFVQGRDIRANTFVLSGAEAHHICSVLRLKSGDVIELFDGTGTLYVAELHIISKNTVEGRITSQYTEVSTDSFPLTLGMGILKGKKMDLVVQKATELGVKTLIPLITRYSEQQKNLNRRMERWQRIVLEACKQCGRSTPMQISTVCPLQEIPIEYFRYSILCWENEKTSVIKPGFFTQPGPIALLTGPEGGFHEKEIRWAQNNNITMTTLGPLVLRAETAAIVGVGIMSYLSTLYERQSVEDSCSTRRMNLNQDR